jgi:2,4-dienoyl-CoA reductase-like NADH-dependent reductase (Old Yellow Enzyme family)/thioredoxin reductase
MYDQLFRPIELGSVTIPNRIVRTAHSTGAPWVDRGDDLIEYHEARARGRVGLSILEIAGVHRTSVTGIPITEDRVVDGYQKLTSRIRPHGMKVFQQLWHGGSARAVPGFAPWSASDVPNPIVGAVPRPMTQGMIDEIVASFASAARRVKDGGLDGLEIHAAHGYLVGQFLSPATNHRTDGYGGPIENRVRFLQEILAAVRAEVGASFPVGVRLSSDEQVSGGLHADEVGRVVSLVESMVDFVDLSYGSYYRFYKMLSTMDDPLGYELESSGAVTRVTHVPTMVTGRIMTLDHANHIVESGVADMVSMVRALIADPELIVKAKDGREAEIRPCIGTSQGCVGMLMTTGRLACVVNPVAGNEASNPFATPEPAAKKKKVVVVGGGPAGLEAARMAALRGHHVTLFEMTRKLGGQVAIAASAPHRSDIGTITSWLAGELERLDVRVRLGTPVDPDLLRAENPDEVIIATGSSPRRDGLQSSRPAVPVPGHDLAHVYTSWDVFGFGGRATIGRNAVVFDDAGTFEAISAAEALVAAGAKVTFVTSLDSIGARVPFPPATMQPMKERLIGAGVEFVTNHSLERITKDSVDLVAVAEVARRTLAADTVVMVGPNALNRELADELADAPFPVHIIGDANGGRSIQAAVAQASNLVKNL